MSVTLTALSKAPVSSSTTATLLTPSSLINFMASKTVLLDVDATTAEWMLMDGRARDCRELERNWVKEGVFSV
jgi:hypothetical protein